jgi:hypothetical protein
MNPTPGYTPTAHRGSLEAVERTAPMPDRERAAMSADDWVDIGTPRVRWLVCCLCCASTPNVSSLLRGWKRHVSRPSYRCATCAADLPRVSPSAVSRCHPGVTPLRAPFQRSRNPDSRAPQGFRDAL